MAEEKCTLCDMRVRNLEVHLKLNHKKKRQKRLAGESFGFTGFVPPSSSSTSSSSSSSSLATSSPTASRLPNLDKIAVITPPQTTNPFTDLKPRFNQGGRSHLSDENINLLAELSRQEKGGNGPPDDFMKQTNWSGQPLTRVKACPECEQEFPWSRSGYKFSNREFFDHIAVCGLGSNSKSKSNPFDRLKFLGSYFPTSKVNISDSSPPISFHMNLLEDSVSVKDESILIEDDPEESIVIEDDKKEDINEKSIVIEEDFTNEVLYRDESIVIEDDKKEDIKDFTNEVVNRDDSIVIDEDDNEGGEDSELVMDFEESSDSVKSSKPVINSADNRSANKSHIEKKEEEIVDTDLDKDKTAHHQTSDILAKEECADSDIPMVQIKIESNLQLFCEASFEKPKVEPVSPDLINPPDQLVDDKSLIEQSSSLPILESNRDDVPETATADNSNDLEEFSSEIHEKIGQAWFDKIEQCSSLPGVLECGTENVPETRIADDSNDLEEFASKIHEKIGQEWFEKISAIEARGSGSSGCEGSPEKKKKKEKGKEKGKEQGGIRTYARRKKTRQSKKVDLVKSSKLGGPFFCPHSGCGKQFLRKDDITRHTMYHHNPKTEDRFRCLFCGAAFHRADKLRVHSRKCNEVLVDDYGDIAESSEEESEETGSTNFQSDEVGASSILLPNRSLSEMVPSSDDQAAADASIAAAVVCIVV